MSFMECNQIPKPPWLRRRLGGGRAFHTITSLLREGGLNTVCEEALCPNRGECFSEGTATFLIMGPVCTRNCGFCAVSKGHPAPLDPTEPSRLAHIAREMGLRHVVVTSVTRDDLPDGGAAQFAATILELKKAIEGVSVEVLVPDFGGSTDALVQVLGAGPDVLNHNVETVPRLYPQVRPKADYRRSLALLERAKKISPQTPTKSGLMLGLGEEPEEVRRVLEDLLEVGCTMVTLGQYLRPSPAHLEVKRYVPPHEFQWWERKALELGFEAVASGPFVRSSYHAAELLTRKGR